MSTNDSHRQEGTAGIDRAIGLAEAALSECDEHGFAFAAIDISSALDKLRAIKLKRIGQ